MAGSLAIVGAGASALSFAHSYVQKFNDELRIPNTIVIFEKSGVFGPGKAYEEDLDTNILNTRTGFISPFQDMPGDFYDWLNANQGDWRPLFPNYSLRKDNYAPRPLFGMYLEARFAWVVEAAIAKRIKIVQLRAEVIDILPVDGEFLIRTLCGTSMTAQHVLLACGATPAERRPPGRAGATVFHTPYPLRTLCKTIRKNASIAILGARLSCIDAVKGLIHEGHNGPISIHSRSGYFPSVRGNQGRLTLQVFTPDALRKLVESEGALRLEHLVALVLQEYAAQGGDPDIVFSVPKPPADIVGYLADEIAASSNSRMWQAILYATNSFIDVAWNHLTPGEQEMIKNRFASAFMSYRVSFPPQNAKLMLEYLKAGKLKFIAGSFGLEHNDDGPHKVSMHDGSEYCYEYIVWAAGSASDVAQMDMPLLHNLLRRGLVSAHPMGGLRVDLKSHKAVDGSGQTTRSLRVLGELSNGQFFFTSALEILVNHASRCLDCFISEMQTATAADANV